MKYRVRAVWAAAVEATALVRARNPITTTKWNAQNSPNLYSQGRLAVC